MSGEGHTETLSAFSQYVNAPYVALLKHLGPDLEFVHASRAVVTGASGRSLLAALHTGSLKSATEIVMQCIQRGVLIMNAFCDRTRIPIEPPLCSTVGQLDTALFAIEADVAHVAARLDPG